MLLSQQKFKVKDDSGSTQAQQQNQVTFLSTKLELVETKKKDLEDYIARATQRANDDKALYSEELTQKMTQQAGEVEKQVEDLQKEELLD